MCPGNTGPHRGECIDGRVNKWWMRRIRIMLLLLLLLLLLLQEVLLLLMQEITARLQFNR